MRLTRLRLLQRSLAGVTSNLTYLRRVGPFPLVCMANELITDLIRHVHWQLS